MDRLKQQSIDRRRLALHDIVKSRKKKLAQLYCISNFPYKPLKTSDVDKFSSYLQAFIEDHGIEKSAGVSETIILQNKNVLESLVSQNETKVAADDVGPVPRPSEMLTSLSVASTGSEIQQPERSEQDGTSRTESKTEGGIIPQAQVDSTKSTAQVVSKTGVSSEAIQTNNEVSKDTQLLKRPLEEEDKSQDNKRARKLGKPTPVEESSFELSKLVQSNALLERQKKELEKLLPDEVDPAKLLYVLQSENVPTKIIQTMPLAKLFYYSKSLQMVKLLVNSHKVLTTDIFESLFLEGKISVVHSRIEELQKQGKWCLKQPKRYLDPFTEQSFNTVPSHTHWDNLLLEGCWMATDYKEDRKFKLATCLFLANAVMDYHRYGKDVCIKPRPINFLTENNEIKDESEMKFEEFISNDVIGIDSPEPQEYTQESNQQYNKESNQGFNQISNQDFDEEMKQESNVIGSTIDTALMNGTNEEPALGKDPLEILRTVKPTEKIGTSQFPFKLQISEDALFGVSRSIVDNLSAYTAFEDSGSLFDSASQIPGREYKNSPIVPISKLLMPFENDQGWYKVVQKQKIDVEDVEATKALGLFATGSTYSKRYNVIKPPPPPPLKYLDLRTPTIWLPQDDSLLVKYANEFSFNWNIISAHLSAKTTKSYTSNIERRTPWQCFERYIQLTDKFQFSDMRGPYAQAAQVWLEAAHKAQTSTKRRILPLGVGKELIQRGHKRLRWASMFEAMRRCMKKRENAPKPSNSNSFKRQMSAEDKSKILSPSDLSRMKYERERAAREVYLHNMSRINMNRKNGDKPTGTADTKNAPAPQRSVSENPNGNSGNSTINASASTADQDTSRAESAPVLTPQMREQLLKQQRPPQLPPQTVNQIIPQPAPGQSLQVKPKDSDITQDTNNHGTVNNSDSSSSGTPRMANFNVSAFNSPVEPHTAISGPAPAVASAANSVNKANTNQNRISSNIHSQVSAIISQIQARNPTWSNEEVTRAAARHLANIQNQIRNRKIQANNTGSNPVVSTGSNNMVPSANQSNNPIMTAVNNQNFANMKQPIGKTINMSKNMISQSLMGSNTGNNPDNEINKNNNPGASNINNNTAASPNSFTGLNGIRLNINSLTPQQKNLLMLQMLQRQQQQQQQKVQAQFKQLEQNQNSKTEQQKQLEQLLLKQKLAQQGQGSSPNPGSQPMNNANQGGPGNGSSSQ